ncbi:MAG: PQQ-like beta-propeller repeat protein [Verrucomicrobia bacterium]|nr:PQQ-like beta-propeller repeat protein [Verrucomicrobiota bacterium]
MKFWTMPRRLALGVLLVALSWTGADAAPPAPFWPEFHGTNRDNRSRETGLLKEWPKDGPKLLWKFSDCGKGYAGVSLAEGLIFTTGDFGDEEAVLALDLNGKLKWKVPNGKAWRGAQPGSRTTPTYSDGVVYQLNAHGQLSACTAASGKPLWSLDLREQFGAPLGGWGFTENVIVEGARLLCMPGGSKGRVVALDKKTGATVWANTEITDRAGYSSPIIVTHQGTRQFITLARETVLGVDVRDGKLLWSHPHPSTCDQNVTSPIYHEGTVYVTSGHKAGGRKITINPDGRSVREDWFSTDLDNCHGGVLLLDGHLYGSGCRLYKRGLMGVEFATGKTLFNALAIGKVSITYADDRLYCLGNDASMALVEVTPQHATVISRFAPPWQNPPPCLSHPVVCGGRLYLRHLDELLAYDIDARR